MESNRGLEVLRYPGCTVKEFKGLATSTVVTSEVANALILNPQLEFYISESF